MPSSQPDATAGQLLDLQREMRLTSSFDSLFSHAAAERAGMHSTDIETLDLLNVLGSMTAGRLSELTGLSSGATTRLIDRLERAGLVRRVPDPDDRRRVHIQPIDANLEEIGALYRPLAEALQHAWAAFSPDELDVILRFVRSTNAVVAAENTRLRALGTPPRPTA